MTLPEAQDADVNGEAGAAALPALVAADISVSDTQQQQQQQLMLASAEQAAGDGKSPTNMAPLPAVVVQREMGRRAASVASTTSRKPVSRNGDHLHKSAAEAGIAGVAASERADTGTWALGKDVDHAQAGRQGSSSSTSATVEDVAMQQPLLVPGGVKVQEALAGLLQWQQLAGLCTPSKQVSVWLGSAAGKSLCCDRSEAVDRVLRRLCMGFAN